jgi:hypothetical protein
MVVDIQKLDWVKEVWSVVRSEQKHSWVVSLGMSQLGFLGLIKL